MQIGLKKQGNAWVSVPGEIQVPENLASVKMDVHRVKEVLIHLLRRMPHNYSAPDAPERITAEARTENFGGGWQTSGPE